MNLHYLVHVWGLLALAPLLLAPVAFADPPNSQSDTHPFEHKVIDASPELEDFDDFEIFDLGHNRSYPLNDEDLTGGDDHGHHHRHHHPTGPINATHCHQSCALTINDNHPKHQREIWHREASGAWLDGWVPDYPVQWSQKLYKEYTHGSMDCSTIDNNDCHAIDDCLKWCHQASPAVYWILKSVSKLNTATAFLHEALQDHVIKDSLTGIDRIVSEFDLEAPAVNPYAVAGAAFGIASGASVAVGPLSGVLAIISGSFGLAAENYHPPDPTVPMKNQLSAYFTHTEAALQNTLKNAVGSGNEDKLPMAARTDKHRYKTPTAQFFAGGKMLFNDAFNTLHPVIKKGKERLQQGLLVRALKANGYRIIIDTTIDNRDDCVKAGSFAARWYGRECFNIWQETSCISNPNYPYAGTCFGTVANRYTKKMVHHYGIDLHELYHNAFHCQKKVNKAKHHHHHHPHDVDPKTIPYDGSLPECFYNFKVVKGSWSSDYWELSDREPLGKWPGK